MKRDQRLCDCGNHVAIPLTFERVALVSPQDAALVADRNWTNVCRNHRAGYAAARITANGLKRYVLMHRLILGVVDGGMVDHANGDTLDNRRENIRLCSHSENSRNRVAVRSKASRFKGVHKDGVRWAFQVFANGKRERGFGFETEHDAARAYDAKAVELHGKFARTNASLGLFVEAE